MSEIIVTRCGNCPAFEPGVCKRLGMAMHASEPPCDWAATGVTPDDFTFTEDDTRELQEFTKKYQPEYWEERRLRC